MNPSPPIRCSMCDKGHLDDDCPYYNAAETKKAREVAAARAKGWILTTFELTEHERSLIAQGHRKCKACNCMIKPDKLTGPCCYHTGHDSRDGMAFYWSCCDGVGEDAMGCIYHKNHTFFE